MITAVFSKPTPDTLTMQVTGHAGYAPPGQDLVCAAASILCYTLAQSLRGAGRLRTEITLTEGASRVAVCCPDPKSLAEARLLFGQIHTGFALLAASYPRYVRVQTPDRP